MTQTKSTPQTTQRVGKWKPYPAYKDSGIEWLGEIPEHWEVIRLKYIAGINQEVLSEDTAADYLLKYVDISNVDSYGAILNAQEMRFEAAPSRARRVVKDGDTIISTVRTYLKAIVLIEDAPENLIVSTGFAVLRPTEQIDAKFLWRLVQSEQFVTRVVAHSEGVGYPAIAPIRLGNLFTWLPPLPEQRAIAAFLDRETTKINTLIARKERLIELLQEKRAVLISQAVTKGLDPNVAMKDSGIEWLGEIPAHWEVKRLKFAVSEPLKYGANESAEFDDPAWPRFIRITDIDEAGALRDETFKSLPASVAEPYLLREGDLLFARSGATVGKTFMYRTSWGCACYAGYLIRARINCRLVLPEYISYFTASASYRNWLTSVFSQSTIQNVNAEKYGNLFLTIPAIDEQQTIVSFLDRETARIDGLISRIREAIEKLREYSTALVSAAVTGKIDVRENVTG